MPTPGSGLPLTWPKSLVLRWGARHEEELHLMTLLHRLFRHRANPWELAAAALEASPVGCCTVDSEPW